MNLTSSRILVVNGDATLHEVMHWLNARQCLSFISVDRLEDLRTELAVPEPVVMLGLRPQGVDPIDALRAVAAIAPGVPVVLVGQLHERVLHGLQRLAAKLGVQIGASLPGSVTADELTAALERCRRTAGGPTAAELRTALQEQQLRLHFQPKFVFKAGVRRPVAVEALVRWEHPELGLLMPGSFLPLAEEACLMTDVTDFTLTEAIHQLALWRDRQVDLTLAVNLAPRLLKDAGFPGRLLANLRQFDISPERLMLEVQETATLVDRDLCLDAFTRLRLNGVGLALDDFGTGFSSLTELYRMPFNEVKIDGSLIADVSRVNEAAVIVRSIIDLAHQLKVNVCAEGVESSAALEFLAGARCDLVQGELLCKPRPPHELERFLSEFFPGLGRAWPSLPDGASHLSTTRMNVRTAATGQFRVARCDGAV